jgi:hypothetical protein
MPAFTLGLASYIAFLDGLYCATGQEIYLRISSCWIRIFSVAFGVGVVSGVIMRSSSAQIGVASRAAGDLKQEHMVRPGRSQTGVFHDRSTPLVFVHDLVAIVLRHLQGLEQDLMGRLENLPDFRF